MTSPLNGEVETYLLVIVLNTSAKGVLCGYFTVHLKRQIEDRYSITRPTLILSFENTT
jgi:hypothetical protein